MFYKLLFALTDEFSAFNVFRYITFRTFLCFLTSFFVCWFFGKRFIRGLVNFQLGQQVRTDGPASHKVKQGTPTMGGLLILIGVLASALLWMDLETPLVQGTLIIILSFGAVGFADDYLKVSKKNTKGLSGRVRLFIEFFVAGSVLAGLIGFGHFDTELTVPFFKEIQPQLGWFYVFFGAFVIVGCANSVNLTDGLDGLAIGTVIVASAVFGLFAYICGHAEIARYLQLRHVVGAAELVPMAGAFVGAGLGFLWYNSHPAHVFMGDVGSLSLGGFIGTMAVLTKNEILLVIIGGVFVIEALSVITQVAFFKRTGRRIFKMAPLHHHFELSGVKETQVVIRFWILAIILAVLSLTTLKLR